MNQKRGEAEKDTPSSRSVVARFVEVDGNGIARNHNERKEADKKNKLKKPEVL